MTQTMRERLIAYLMNADIPADEPGFVSPDRELAAALVDGILGEICAEADRVPGQSHEGMIYEMARAIGLADSGTDIEVIASGRGSYEGYMDCARAAFTAMIDHIRSQL